MGAVPGIKDSDKTVPFKKYLNLKINTKFLPNAISIVIHNK